MAPHKKYANDNERKAAKVQRRRQQRANETLEEQQHRWDKNNAYKRNPKESSRVPVFIKVLDVNDNAPEFAMLYEIFVCENAKAEQIIHTVSAIDKDDSYSGLQFSYEVANPAAHSTNFTVKDNRDNTAGIYTRRNGYSRHEMNTYLLPVVISDYGFPIQSSTGTLTIRVCACDHKEAITAKQTIPVTVNRVDLI
ncbi:unnamed protein product [Ranitomeya imitator]|uniref:Cadherin domain-containing protein n=1 Tax=Ranitomeya imitator TaxID=111125 RepID=A0ABN9LNA3_9NEOB|nr:unnamed protein product [Ranitomeya imitator]